MRAMAGDCGGVGACHQLLKPVCGIIGVVVGGCDERIGKSFKRRHEFFERAQIFAPLDLKPGLLELPDLRRKSIQVGLGDP